MITPGWFHQIGVITKKKHLHEAAVASPGLRGAAHWNWSAQEGVIFFLAYAKYSSNLRSAMMVWAKGFTCYRANDWLLTACFDVARHTGPGLCCDEQTGVTGQNIGRVVQRRQLWLAVAQSLLASYTVGPDRTAPSIHKTWCPKKQKTWISKTLFTKPW